MLKAITTTYQGYRFRSRLEARWAVFFDSLGIPWEYEKEGYDLDGARYLPDFWLPEQQIWVEIKGEKPTDEELRKVFALVEHTHRMAIILDGQVPRLTGLKPFGRGKEYPRYYVFAMCADGGAAMTGGAWAECEGCRRIGLADGDSMMPPFCECPFRAAREHQFAPAISYASERLAAAHDAARAARFEHGEKPVTVRRRR